MVQFSWWWLESWVKFVRHILVPLELGSRKLRFLFFRSLWGAGIPLFACCVRGRGGSTPETISMLLGLGIFPLNQPGCYFKPKPAGVPNHFCFLRKQLSDYAARLNEMLLCLLSVACQPVSVCARFGSPRIHSVSMWTIGSAVSERSRSKRSSTLDPK